jgi:hypothetical protein
MEEYSKTEWDVANFYAEVCELVRKPYGKNISQEEKSKLIQSLLEIRLDLEKEV